MREAFLTVYCAEAALVHVVVCAGSPTSGGDGERGPHAEGSAFRLGNVGNCLGRAKWEIFVELDKLTNASSSPPQCRFYNQAFAHRRRRAPTLLSTTVMKLNALLLLSTLGLGVVNGERLNRRHIAKRQAAAGTTVTTTPVTTSPTTVASTTSTQVPTTIQSTAVAPVATTTSTTSTVAQPTTAAVASSSTSSTTAAAQAGLTTTVPSGPPALATGTTIPPLSEITLGMPTRVTLAAETTITAGATPPIKGAPVIPTPAASDCMYFCRRAPI